MTRETRRNPIQKKSKRTMVAEWNSTISGTGSEAKESLIDWIRIDEVTLPMNQKHQTSK